MKLQNFILVAAAAAAMSSCSNEELDSNLLADSNAISFNAVANKASRANIVNATNEIKNFTVDAFTNSGAKYMDGTIIKNNGSSWVYANDADLRYWPNTGKLNFYAVSPAIIEEGATGYTNEFTATSQTISYTATDEYKGGKKNTDVMYAVAGPQNGGVVELQFHHILSQVIFKAKTELESMTVSINGLRIYNVKSQGTFALPAVDTETPANTKTKLGRWAALTLLTATNNYTVPVNSETLYVNNEAKFINEGDPLLMIPQTLAKWTVDDDKKTITDASFTESYLAIDCKIKQAGQYLVGGESSYTTIYVPFGTTWEPGKRYTYTLIFGGGYDENGNAILTPITFTADVDEWVDAASEVTF